MPATVKKVGKNAYMVRTPNMVHAKKTDKKNAYKQKHLLDAMHYSDWKPTKRR